MRNSGHPTWMHSLSGTLQTWYTTWISTDICKINKGFLVELYKVTWSKLWPSVWPWRWAEELIQSFGTNKTPVYDLRVSATIFIYNRSIHDREPAVHPGGPFKLRKASHDTNALVGSLTIRTEWELDSGMFPRDVSNNGNLIFSYIPWIFLLKEFGSSPLEKHWKVLLHAASVSKTSSTQGPFPSTCPNIM